MSPLSFSCHRALPLPFRTVRTPSTERAVVKAFRKNPKLSTRKAAARDDLPSRTTIQRILKVAKFRAYKLRYLHKLKRKLTSAMA